jgi:hypothetical protein
MTFVVNCPVEVPISVLSAQERYCIVLCDDRQLKISGLHRDVVHIFALLRCYTAYVGSLVPTFRDNISAVQGHRLKPLLHDVPVQRRPQCCQLPRLSRGWCLTECMWSIGGMTLTGDNTSTRRDTRSTANLSTINPIRTGLGRPRRPRSETCHGMSDTAASGRC